VACILHGRIFPDFYMNRRPLIKIKSRYERMIRVSGKNCGVSKSVECWAFFTNQSVCAKTSHNSRLLTQAHQQAHKTDIELYLHINLNTTNEQVFNMRQEMPQLFGNFHTGR